MLGAMDCHLHWKPYKTCVERDALKIARGLIKASGREGQRSLISLKQAAIARAPINQNLTAHAGLAQSIKDVALVPVAAPLGGAAGYRMDAA